VAQIQPKNRGNAGKGRPKGALNLATRAIKEIATGLLEDPDYQVSLAARLKAGKAPHMETLLHHYAYGKPLERVSMTVDDRREQYRELTDDAIQARALELTTELNGHSVH
jgi:hypothetical protein